MPTGYRRVSELDQIVGPSANAGHADLEANALNFGLPDLENRSHNI
jgi:hypothetical protein